MREEEEEDKEERQTKQGGKRVGKAGVVVHSECLFNPANLHTNR